MDIKKELKKYAVPNELKNYIGDYYKALVERAKLGYLGKSEFYCYKRFIIMYNSKKYRFAFKAIDRMLKYLSYLVYIDEEGRKQHLKLFPAQKFMLCGIFGLRTQDGHYIVNTAKLWVARRNGKSFFLGGLLHVLMGMSRYKNELMILASCKGQNATICFNEFCKFIDNDKDLASRYSNVNRTAYWAKIKDTNNKLELFRTGGQAKKQLDGFTNKVAVVDESALCDEIILNTIQDGQAHFKDSLLVEMSTAQFNIGSQQHIRWTTTKKQLYEDDLPDNEFVFLCDSDIEDKDFSNITTWAKANPILLYEEDGYTVKDYIVEKYTNKAQKAVIEKSFALQNFVTKQCNIWYTEENKSLCSYEQLQKCKVKYHFEDLINAGYKDWYCGIDLSMVSDLSSVTWCTYFGVDENNNIVNKEKEPYKYRLFLTTKSWLPLNKLQQHIDKDKFYYGDYVNNELFLCNSAGGENIDINQIYDYINEVREKYNLHYITFSCDPYNIAGIQEKLDNICDYLILQNQAPKALSQYIESFSSALKNEVIAFNEYNEKIFEKAIANCVLFKNSTGFYSIEKVSLKAESNIRIDPVDSALDGFIPAFIDFSKKDINSAGDDIIDEWNELWGDLK